ncbi:unnamed protein product [Heterobilharzia americana]|nr:unnamed protein product [Heterobilharzia americana]
MSPDLLKTVTHAQRVRFLYKFILSLHRSLPPTLRKVGDIYVQTEFKKHRDVKPEFIQPFMIEWTKYAVELSKQIKQSMQRANDKEINEKSVSEATFGKPLDEKSLNHFSEAQLNQLLSLAKEIHDENSESRE